MTVFALVDAVISKTTKQVISFEQINIKKPLILASSDTIPAAGNVYVASIYVAESLLKKLRHSVPVTIFIASSGSTADVSNSRGSNIIYVQMSLEQLFNCLNTRLQDIATYKLRCVEDALRSTSPIHLVKRCSQKLGGAVFLLNHQMEVVQEEIRSANTSALVEGIQASGLFPLKAVCGETDIREFLDATKVYTTKQGEFCLIRAVSTGVHIRFLLVAILSAKAVISLSTTYLEICCELISAQFQREENAIQPSALPGLLDYVSANRAPAPEELRTKLNCLEKPIKRFYATILVYADSNRIDFSLQRAFQRVREAFPLHNVAVYNGHIVVLFCKERMFFKQDFDIKALEALMEELGAFMIVCNATSSWNMLHVNYNLALSTMHIVTVMTESDTPVSSRRVYFYADYYGFIAIDMCRNALLKMGGTDDALIYLGDPSIAHLAVHDNMHRDNLVNVLHKYLLAGGNISKASELLFMHRNTVQKKMVLIKEITNLDFDDPGIYFSLLFSCMVLQYYKHYLHRPLPVSLPEHTNLLSLWPTYFLDL